MRLLIIEDEKELSDSIRSYLDKAQYSCEVAYDYDSAIEKIHSDEYSCIILDISLPNGSGLDILNELKNTNKTDGVLIVSAKNSLEDKISGLQMGADDYLAKPFHLPELGARIAAIIRRKSFGTSHEIVIDQLVVDLQEKTLKLIVPLFY